jgi:hypothetical protein
MPCRGLLLRPLQVGVPRPTRRGRLLSASATCWSASSVGGRPEAGSGAEIGPPKFVETVSRSSVANARASPPRTAGPAMMNWDTEWIQRLISASPTTYALPRTPASRPSVGRRDGGGCGPVALPQADCVSLADPVAGERLRRAASSFIGVTRAGTRAGGQGNDPSSAVGSFPGAPHEALRCSSAETSALGQAVIATGFAGVVARSAKRCGSPSSQPWRPRTVSLAMLGAQVGRSPGRTT